jgi:large subunit ribosomal protein L36
MSLELYSHACTFILPDPHIMYGPGKTKNPSNNLLSASTRGDSIEHRFRSLYDLPTREREVEPHNSRFTTGYLPPTIMFSLRSVLGAPAALRQLLPSVSRRSLPGAISLRPFSHMIQNSLTRLRAASKQNNNAVAATVGASRQIEQVRGMKTRSSVKRLCDGCKV